MTTTTSHNDASAWHHSPIRQVLRRPAPQWPARQQQLHNPGPVGTAIGGGMALTSAPSQRHAGPFRDGDDSRLTSAIDRWAQLLYHSTWLPIRRWAEDPRRRAALWRHAEPRDALRVLTRGTRERCAYRAP